MLITLSAMRRRHRSGFLQSLAFTLLLIVWAADVGAYVVYRAAGGGPFVRVGSVQPPATTFVDRGVPPGRYRYVVTAQDTSTRANESARSNEVAVSVP